MQITCPEHGVIGICKGDPMVCPKCGFNPHTQEKAAGFNPEEHGGYGTPVKDPADLAAAGLLDSGTEARESESPEAGGSAHETESGRSRESGEGEEE